MRSEFECSWIQFEFVNLLPWIGNERLTNMSVLMPNDPDYCSAFRLHGKQARLISNCRAPWNSITVNFLVWRFSKASKTPNRRLTRSMRGATQLKNICGLFIFFLPSPDGYEQARPKCSQQHTNLSWFEAAVILGTWRYSSLFFQTEFKLLTQQTREQSTILF